ncbi:unnamed protein product [Miscanthus lutarioriparius]|uniref:tRNA/rRNA methyltransferase SpoU type domain-containing protein n=1 Tax=Miscanthus lutarioriparius TaxID=422564 RepID=A0A811R3M2_9POAL|nr:unnamed protein product [Miscanthus lutarioriparius]
MEAGLRALGHRYCGGCAVSLGGFAAARAIRLRRQRRAAAFCSLAVSGDGNGAAGVPVGSGVEVARASRMLHVVLVSPLIPGNTGSIARTCAASAVGLHLVGEGDKRLLAFTKRGTQIHSDFSYRPGDWLVFGSETKGLPQQALEDCCPEGLGGGTPDSHGGNLRPVPQPLRQRWNRTV